MKLGFVNMEGEGSQSWVGDCCVHSKKLSYFTFCVAHCSCLSIPTSPILLTPAHLEYNIALHPLMDLVLPGQTPSGATHLNCTCNHVISC